MPFSAPKHQPIGVIPWKVRKPLQDAAGPSPSRTYGRQWQRLRHLKLNATPICEHPGCGQPATVVDHKTPHRGDYSLMYAWDNLASMCKPHHDAKTAAMDGGFGNPRRSNAR